MGYERRMKKIEGLLVTAPWVEHILHTCKRNLTLAFDPAVDDVVEHVAQAATVLKRDFGLLGEASSDTGRQAIVWMGMVKARWEHYGVGSEL